MDRVELTDGRPDCYLIVVVRSSVFAFSLAGGLVRLAGVSTPPVRLSAMADSKHWTKAQAERLEEARAQELELREMWRKTEKAKNKDSEKKKEAEGWAWGSWWSGQWDWSRDQWSEQGGSRGSQDQDPPQNAEPTASTEGGSTTPPFIPLRTVGEDFTALRHAAITPASFMPQRHVTMALGRPVVVLAGIRSAFGSFRGGSSPGGRELAGGLQVEWRGLGCRVVRWSGPDCWGERRGWLKCVEMGSDRDQ